MIVIELPVVATWKALNSVFTGVPETPPTIICSLTVPVTLLVPRATVNPEPVDPDTRVPVLVMLS